MKLTSGRIFAARFRTNWIADRSETLTKHGDRHLSLNGGLEEVQNTRVPRLATVIKAACTAN